MSGVPILIVDDHPANAMLLSFLLVNNGYEVRTAADAEQALKMLQEFKPRIILMDLQLPGIDGLELTRRLKLDQAHRHTLIIAVTASAMKGDEEKALAAGCDGYITKPINTRTLVKVVESFLDAGASGR